MTDPMLLAAYLAFVVYGLIGLAVSARTDGSAAAVVSWPVVAIVAAVGLVALWAAADEVES